MVDQLFYISFGFFMGYISNHDHGLLRWVSLLMGFLAAEMIIRGVKSTWDNHEKGGYSK